MLSILRNIFALVWSTFELALIETLAQGDGYLSVLCALFRSAIECVGALISFTALSISVAPRCSFEFNAHGLKITMHELSDSKLGSSSLTLAGKKGESAFTIFAKANDSFGSNLFNEESDELFTEFETCLVLVKSFIGFSFALSLVSRPSLSNQGSVSN